MVDLPKLEVFLGVAVTLSFSKAAKQLGISRSMVSQHIKALEEQLKTTLFLRTTRSVSLTESGHMLATSTKRVFESLDETFSSIQKLQSIPKGTVRISCTVDVGINQMAKIVSEFSREYPTVHIVLNLEDTIVDLARENYDIGIRVGWLEDSSFLRTKIAPFYQLLCASAGYVEKHGQPSMPLELLTHTMIHLTALQSPDRLVFYTSKGQTITVRTTPAISTNSPSGVQAAVEHGAGIGLFTDFQAKKGLAAGTLIHILPQYKLSHGGVYAVSPHGRSQPYRVKTFLRFLQSRWGEDVF